MSEALRPWIRDYFESYVSRYDDLGKIHMRRGKVQILSVSCMRTGRAGIIKSELVS